MPTCCATVKFLPAASAWILAAPPGIIGRVTHQRNVVNYFIRSTHIPSMVLFASRAPKKASKFTLSDWMNDLHLCEACRNACTLFGREGGTSQRHGAGAFANRLSPTSAAGVAVSPRRKKRGMTS